MDTKTEGLAASDRQTYIDYLVFFTNKTEGYFEKLSDREVIEEYSILIKLD